MRAVGQFVVRVAELMEAEARAARRGSFHLAAAIVTLAIAAAVVLTGVGFLVAAVFLVLNTVMQAWAAAGLMGLILLVAAFALMALAVHLRDKKASSG